MSDPWVREIGRVVDEQGRMVIVGVDYDTVTLRTLRTRTSGAVTLASWKAEEFAQLYVSACWQAAAQAPAITGAQRTGLEMCLADCGEPVHDQDCIPQPERNPA